MPRQQSRRCNFCAGRVRCRKRWRHLPSSRQWLWPDNFRPCNPVLRKKLRVAESRLDREARLSQRDSNRVSPGLGPGLFSEDRHDTNMNGRVEFLLRTPNKASNREDTLMLPSEGLATLPFHKESLILLKRCEGVIKNQGTPGRTRIRQSFWRLRCFPVHQKGFGMP